MSVDVVDVVLYKQILDEEAGDDPESHAAKLLEVILLQYKGEINQVQIKLKTTSAFLWCIVAERFNASKSSWPNFIKPVSTAKIGYRP